MMSDKTRMDAYTEALRRAVTPGSTVIDIGTGAGIFALLACRFGAGKVYAIEPSDALVVARKAAADSGYAGRITFIQGLSTEFTPSNSADVIISDLRGQLPFHTSHIPSIIDARSRLLKSGGTLIPLRDELWAGVINAEETWNEYTSAWKLHGFDYREAVRMVTNTTGWRIKDLKPSMLSAPAQRWATLDYTSIESPNVKGEAEFIVERDGPAHGILIWFDAEVAEGIGFSNAPESEIPASVYGRSFFPWPESVVLHRGDEATITIEARLINQEYIYLWKTSVNGKVLFRQSTFYGEPLSLRTMNKRGADYLPALNVDGRVDHFILSCMTKGMTNNRIAEELIESYPEMFPKLKDALGRVGDLSIRYSD